MASINQTEKSRYPSVYSPGQYVTLAQYLCEKVCERAAKKEYKELPLQFWRIKKWSQFYVFQSKLVNKLLKTYKPEAVLHAFNDKRCKSIYSFNAPWFLPVVEEYNAKTETKIEATEELDAPPEGLRPSSGQKSLASLLD